jgi:Rhodopirellula transposase DDE domain
LLWTNLTASEIAQQITSRGHRVSVHIVEQLLDEHDYHRRKAQKSLPMKESVDRDQQFLTISHWTQEYLDAGEPILSMDSKKRELIGNFYRSGVLLTKQAIGVFDHDYPSFAEGVVIPHGLYDERLNRGYVHLGTSHDTSEFAGDCLLDWWERFGQQRYPQAKKLLLKCDGGGSNSVNTYLFKAEMQRLADATGLELRVAHYPSYCSKYNPIEHRLFPHLTRACRGVIFQTLETVRYYMAKAKTTTGLKVKVSILDKVYETGRKYAAGFKKTMKIVFDKFLPKWNYRAVPEPA